MAKTKRKNTNKKAPIKFLVIITLALVVVMGALLFVVNGGGSSTADEGTPPIEDVPTAGDESAPVSIVEFGDYKCPGCLYWDSEIVPQLYDDYVDNGDASLSFYNYIGFGEESLQASLAAQAIHEEAPDQFWSYHHALMQQAGQEGSQVTQDMLLNIAEDHAPDVDQEELESAIANEEMMSRIEDDQEIIQQYSVQSTPTIMVNDQVIDDPFDYDEIQDTIDEELAVADS
ncbi:thioredoxin domain-containing protein [Natribacillus halophilus]|uniref:Protein-disulfide isomerase n=1 Tax=Natribacillus halophilus TaxID=549003 RepID=A0A1G8NLK7_9BACI|nr:thioredoxin domain-containing protein [Natribacillus halophilus]SDI81084.1 Protein-disulfide isomerase [Natribacillus halophilus]